MKTIFSVLLILSSALSYADTVARYEGVARTPVKNQKVNLTAELTLKTNLENVVVRTERDLDSDPDRTEKQYSCRTIISAEAGIAKFTVEHRGTVRTKNSIIEIHATNIGADDGECKTPNLGDTKVLSFNTSTVDSKFSIIEKKRKSNSDYQVSFPFLTSGTVTVVKNSDGKYGIATISYSEKMDVIRNVPETVSAHAAQYDPDLKIQDSIILKKK